MNHAQEGDRIRRRRLGEVLVDAGILVEGQVEHALATSGPRERLGETLIRLGMVDENQVADALAAQLGLERIEVAETRPDPMAVDRLPSRLAERHRVLPLRIENDTLVLAVADPTDLVALDDVRLAVGVRSVRPVVGAATQVEEARRKAYRADAAHELIEELDPGAAMPDEDEFEVTEDSQPVVRLVDALLAEAVGSRGSDVHVEPDADGIVVRVRVDGLLRETMRIPRALGRQVVSRLKIMSSLDIAERRLPQDGRAMVRVDGGEIDLRVSTMPTMHGETVVLRLLPRGADRIGLHDLGLPTGVTQLLLETLERPQGLVLVTGPTGSGKTSTLYAGLAAVADPTRNVLTLEDPVEVQLPGVNQTQVEPKIGLTFARGLRHVLRQDPDVVLVGEIRDQETAQLAVEASFTGHLVLATLHTNDAPSSVARLVDLGADPFLVASSLLLVLAQRLARKVCEHCAVEDAPDQAVLARLGLESARLQGARLRRGTGCRRCDDTGTLGRIALGEALRATPSFRELVMDRAAESSLARHARTEGLITLREDAISRALEGTITLDEALRVTPDPSVDGTTCPRCGTPAADDHLACARCGEALVPRPCGACGRACEDDWETCPWCRASLVGAG